MPIKITLTSIIVDDQEKALRFYPSWIFPWARIAG